MHGIKLGIITQECPYVTLSKIRKCVCTEEFIVQLLLKTSVIFNLKYFAWSLNICKWLYTISFHFENSLCYLFWREDKSNVFRIGKIISFYLNTYFIIFEKSIHKYIIHFIPLWPSSWCNSPSISWPFQLLLLQTHLYICLYINATCWVDTVLLLCTWI